MPSGNSPLPKPASGHFWLWIVCLLGLDYFSTLAYQPSITYEVAGLVGPLATGVVVLVTLLAALPVYWYLAGRSPSGTGSIGLLERVVHGWRGKTLVLLLLGFAAADFTMLKTISLADAAVHLLKNEEHDWQGVLERLTERVGGQVDEQLGTHGSFNQQLLATLLLGVVGFVFWFLLRKGFNRKVLALAVPLIGIFLIFNGMMIVGGLCELAAHPEIVGEWLDHLRAGELQTENRFGAHGGWGRIATLAFLYFPNLALGLSGFELSLMVMPQIRGAPGDDPAEPAGRIRNTRKALVTAACIMSFCLLGSVFVTTLLIPSDEMRLGGRAANRALAYLAHGGSLTTGTDKVLPWCGPLFGSLYDLVTILVLCLAGTSVMTALRVLLPQFLLRFGMVLLWAHRWGALLISFALVNLAVTLYFRASVWDQRGAYTTAVLVLMACSAIVTALDIRRSTAESRSTWRRFNVAYLTFVAWGMVAACLAAVVMFRGGVMIATLFVFVLLASSVVARGLRADEVRTTCFKFKDEQSKMFWHHLRLLDFPALVPHRPGRENRADKERRIRNDHQLALDAEIVFLEIEVGDPSDFFQELIVEVVSEERRFVIKLANCTSAAHAIAAVALEMSRHSRPPCLHFGWSEMDLLTASWSYLAFGEGNVPGKVRELILRAEPDPKKQPRVVVG